MAAVTTNYGFDVPTSSDLVKNGATQIALLGQDLDTFLFRPLAVNPIINAACEIAQRGTTAVASTGATTQFMTDRWQVFRAVAGGTFSRQNTNDTTNLPNIRYCIRAARDSGNTATNSNFVYQNIETVNTIPFAGRTVTISYYARSGANYSGASSLLNVRLSTGTGTDQNYILGYTGSANPINSQVTLTTTWQRFTATATLGATVTEMAFVAFADPTGTAGANDWFEITGVQIEAGSQATPFRTNSGTIQGELAACQRYYQRYSSSVADPYTHFFLGLATSTTQVRGILTIPPMRTKIIDMSYGGNFTAVGTTGALTLQGPGTQTTGLNIAVTGATTNQVYAVYANNDANAYFAFNAEL